LINAVLFAVDLKIRCSYSKRIVSTTK